MSCAPPPMCLALPPTWRRRSATPRPNAPRPSPQRRRPRFAAAPARASRWARGRGGGRGPRRRRLRGEPYPRTRQCPMLRPVRLPARRRPRPPRPQAAPARQRSPRAARSARVRAPQSSPQLRHPPTQPLRAPPPRLRWQRRREEARPPTSKATARFRPPTLKATAHFCCSSGRWPPPTLRRLRPPLRPLRALPPCLHSRLRREAARPPTSKVAARFC
mmetsp:Transcript_99216/g.266536  ORF Transcript_99216/g.266536 Transcript_99216/m.266536 type:complete len:218 (-) Transcript_99216:515-1168(-)